MKAMAKTPILGELIEADKVLGAMEQATIKTGKGWKGVAAGAGEMFKQIKTGIGQIGILAMFNAVFKVIKFIVGIAFQLSKNMMLSFPYFVKKMSII